MREWSPSGRMHVRHDDGTEIEIGPGDAYVIEPGHDAWVTGSDVFVGYEFDSKAAETFARADPAAVRATSARNGRDGVGHASTKSQESPSRTSSSGHVRHEHDFTVGSKDGLFAIDEGMVGPHWAHTAELERGRRSLKHPSEELGVHVGDMGTSVRTVSERVDERAIVGKEAGNGHPVIGGPGIDDAPEEPLRRFSI